LMTVLSPVVHPGTGSDEDVLDVGQSGDPGLCRRVATGLVGHDLAWPFGTRGKHAPKKIAWLPPCRDTSAAGCRVRHRVDRLLATTDKARRAWSQTGK
jgi:hypothetical protein